MESLLQVSPEERLYVYFPLQPGRRIRTIHLLPAVSPDLPLRCHIQEIDFDDSGSLTYEAISYTWGEAKFNHTLRESKQGSILYITQSLSDALRCFRLRDRIRVLWADAVCINQKDDVEKSSQIPLMNDIYRRAEGVLVWMGNDSQTEASISSISWASKSFGIEFGEAEKQQTVASFDILLEQPWFGRRWVIQEVVCNHNVKFHCESSSLSWIRLIASVAQLGEETGTSRPAAFGALKQMRSMWERMVLLGDPEAGRTLVENLHDFRHFECGDPRDRIFALAALSSDVSMTSEPKYPKRNVPLDTLGPVYWAKPQPKERVFRIVPDYSKTVRQVYTSFAAEAVRNGLLSWLLL